MFCKKGAIKNFAVLTGKQLFWSLAVLESRSGLKPATLLKRDSKTGVFLITFGLMLKIKKESLENMMQPFTSVLHKSSSEKVPKIHRKTPVSWSLF